MQEYCHRCGEELPAGNRESPFCPNCGSPQLFLSLENQSAETGGEQPPSGGVGSATTGMLPPPSPRQVEWKTAIRCAAAVAGIGAVLSLGSIRVMVLSPVSFLWVMSASLITMGLYQKQRPAAWMDMRIGARIGVVVGLFLALGLSLAVAGWGVVERFGLHSMGNFDQQLAATITEGQRLSQQLTAAPTPPEIVAFERTPEFHAGYVLAEFAMASAFLLVLSTVGGAFAGLLRMRRGPAA